MWRRAAASFCSLKTLPEWLSDFAEFICRVLFTNHWRIKTDDGQNWSLITFIIAGSDDKCDCWITWITFMMNGLTLDVRWSWLNVECLRQRINTRPNNPVNLTAASDHQQSGAPRQWYGRGLINDVSSPLSFLATSVCQFVFKSSRFLDDSFHHFISFFISTLAEQWYHLLHNETETISDVDTWKRDALRRHFFSSAKQQQKKWNKKIDTCITLSLISRQREKIRNAIWMVIDSTDKWSFCHGDDGAGSSPAFGPAVGAGCALRCPPPKKCNRSCRFPFDYEALTRRQLKFVELLLLIRHCPTATWISSTEVVDPAYCFN